MIHETHNRPIPWNKGKLCGQKRPLKPRDIWSIRIHLEMADRKRDLALFNLGIDSKLRGCDLVRLQVRDVMQGGHVMSRASVLQSKTERPVQFEITETTQAAVSAWVAEALLMSNDYLFPSRINTSPHLSTRQYARLLKGWIRQIGLESNAYGTHSIRRTKATLIYRQTRNLRAVQLLLGHTKLESTVRYLGVEVDDALALAEKTEI